MEVIVESYVLELQQRLIEIILAKLFKSTNYRLLLESTCIITITYYYYHYYDYYYYYHKCF